MTNFHVQNVLTYWQLCKPSIRQSLRVAAKFPRFCILLVLLANVVISTAKAQDPDPIPVQDFPLKPLGPDESTAPCEPRLSTTVGYDGSPLISIKERVVKSTVIPKVLRRAKYSTEEHEEWESLKPFRCRWYREFEVIPALPRNPYSLKQETTFTWSNSVAETTDEEFKRKYAVELLNALKDQLQVGFELNSKITRALEETFANSVKVEYQSTLDNPPDYCYTNYHRVHWTEHHYQEHIKKTTTFFIESNKYYSDPRGGGSYIAADPVVREIPVKTQECVQHVRLDGVVKGWRGLEFAPAGDLMWIEVAETYVCVPPPANDRYEGKRSEPCCEPLYCEEPGPGEHYCCGWERPR